MDMLPAENKVRELRRGTGNDLSAKEGQTAALHLLEVRRHGPLEGEVVASAFHRFPMGANGHQPAGARPALELPFRPRRLERVSLQNVAQSDQGVRFQEA